MAVMDKIRVSDGPKGKGASGGQSKIANPKDKGFAGLQQTEDTGQTIDQGQKEPFLGKSKAWG